MTIDPIGLEAVKAHVGGLLFGGGALVGQAGDVAGIGDLDGGAWVKSLIALVLGWVAVYLTPNAKVPSNGAHAAD